MLTSVEEGDRPDGVAGLSESGRIMAFVASERVVDVSSRTGSCDRQPQNNNDNIKDC